jgi:hypothetical protein
MFINGLPVSSLSCYTDLLCLHQCLPAHITYALCSSASYPLCTMSLLCTIPLLCILVVALCLLLHTSITLNSNNPHLLFVLYSYSLCAPCAFSMHNASACSSQRVLFLIIITTLQLLWQFNPFVHHHWVLCQDSLAFPAVETLRLLCHSRAHSLCCSYNLQCSYICQSLL